MGGGGAEKGKVVTGVGENMGAYVGNSLERCAHGCGRSCGLCGRTWSRG